MNEYHFPIVYGRWDYGGACFMYKFMHVCTNVCISLYVYVGVLHVCVYMYLWRMTLSISKRKQNSWFLVRRYVPTFYRQAWVLLRLLIVPRHLPHTHCRLTQSVLPLQRNKLCSLPPRAVLTVSEALGKAIHWGPSLLARSHTNFNGQLNQTCRPIDIRLFVL